MKPHPTRHILAAALLLCSILPATAADQTATLTGGGDWNSSGVWSTNPLFPNNGNGGFTYDVIQNAH